VHPARRFRGERESRALDRAVKPSRVGSPGRARNRGGDGAPIAGNGRSEFALSTSGAGQHSYPETAYGCVRGSCWSRVPQRACDMKNLAQRSRPGGALCSRQLLVRRGSRSGVDPAALCSRQLLVPQPGKPGVAPEATGGDRRRRANNSRKQHRTVPGYRSAVGAHSCRGQRRLIRPGRWYGRHQHLLRTAPDGTTLTWYGRHQHLLRTAPDGRTCAMKRAAPTLAADSAIGIDGAMLPGTQERR
jgi:hypothetical protein